MTAQQEGPTSTHLGECPPPMENSLSSIDGLLLAAVLLLVPHFIVMLLAQYTSSLPTKPQQSFPDAISEGLSLTILIPARDEPLEIIRKTLLACRKYTSSYVKTEVILIDNSRCPAISISYRKLVSELGLGYIFVGACQNKAEALNKALTYVSTEWFAVLDSDQRPVTDSLDRLATSILLPGNIALVQTPQIFRGKDVLQCAVFCQEQLFYELIMPFRDRFGATICVGTNFVARVDAVKQVGGFSRDTATEDIDLSWKLVLNGYSVKYLRQQLFVGIPPTDLATYLAQRRRYARGAAALLRRLFLSLPSMLKSKSPRAIWDVWLLYLQAGLWYLTGCATLILLLIPIVRLAGIAQAGSALEVLGGFILFLMLLWSTYIMSQHCGLKRAITAQVLMVSASLHFCLGLVEVIWNPASFHPSRKSCRERSTCPIPSLPGLIGLVLVCLGCASLWQRYNVLGTQMPDRLLPVYLLVNGIVYLFPDMLEWKSRFKPAHPNS